MRTIQPNPIRRKSTCVRQRKPYALAFGLKMPSEFLATQIYEPASSRFELRSGPRVRLIVIANMTGIVKIIEIVDVAYPGSPRFGMKVIQFEVALPTR